MGTPEGTGCRRGHGVEHQGLRSRGRVCKQCARECRVRYNKNRAQRKTDQANGIVIPSRFSPERIEAMTLNFAVQAERRRVSPTCDSGHLWTLNAMFRKSGTRLCRECIRLQAKQRTKTKIASQRQVSEVLEGLRHGLTLNQMTSSRNKTGVYRPHGDIKRVVGSGPLYNFFKTHPALGQKMKDASKRNGLKNLRAAYSSQRVVAAPALMLNNGVDAFEAVRRATAGIWEGDRDDVQTLMWIDIAENKLKISDCTPERTREYLKIHRRRPNVFGSYSLDTPIGEDSGMTWLDTKTDGDRLWA
jgi:hypothetical protein